MAVHVCNSSNGELRLEDGVSSRQAWDTFSKAPQEKTFVNSRATWNGFSAFTECHIHLCIQFQK